tara:strand:+ start:7 stop:1632 length:1626 start_codon:yes stop_codon:yes gene_type:complete
MKSFSNENRRIISELTSDIESILIEADTGVLNTWDPKKDGLTASVEFVDPNSSKYKYVAYYSDSSKEVDHFLVTYDQHTNAHHSTEKTLKWDDSRQTRKQAYNSLICSDTVKNTLKLKPKQGSDAECAVPAKSAAKIAPVAQQSTQSRSASVSTAPQEKEIDKTNAENICSVNSKVIGRTTILDFSNCPITPDTISNPRGISFPRGVITRMVFRKKDNRDQSPYLDTELIIIKFNNSKKDRSQRSSFNNYFNYLRRVMAHVVKEGWVITGDLDSFPRFTVAYKNSVNEEIEKDIDDIVKLLLERGRGYTAGHQGQGRGLTGGGSGYSRGSTSDFSSNGRSNYGSDVGSSYTGDMVVVSGGLKFLGDPSVGLSPARFWEELRNDLQAYMKKHYPELELKTDNLGVARDLHSSLNPSSDDRAKGSKHGAGLAADVYLHVKDHPFKAYKVDNPRLAKDKKLVKLMRAFTATQQGIVWGGDFGGGKGDNVASRGITEFHHFEIEDASMPKYFSQFNDEIEALDGDLTAAGMNNTNMLARLYSKIS